MAVAVLSKASGGVAEQGWRCWFGTVSGIRRGSRRRWNGAGLGGVELGRRRRWTCGRKGDHGNGQWQGNGQRREEGGGLGKRRRGGGVGGVGLLQRPIGIWWRRCWFAAAGQRRSVRRGRRRRILVYRGGDGGRAQRRRLRLVRLIVSCLQGTINYKKLGAKLPRGILLVGPPGTGKTLLARSVAGEAGVPFFSVSASEFVELFVGRGAARVRDLFNVAKECSPSIVFIDELDAVGGKRGRSFNDERDQTLNQLLTEMDGFELDTKVIVIAATNRPEALDPALCRPGRFSRKVLVGEPDFEGRKKILAVHLRQVPLDEEIEIICDLVASLTTGLVGADLANIVNEAALLAARRGAETVTRDDMMEAVERAKFGINEKRSSPMTISKSLVKLFPWMPTSIGKDGFQGLMGYQTLS
ncbi:putative inactive ATP-dependent zinc metalloprotease FTSHI 3, chloroplastic [Curcuma longa]|uniref:putative inactive ATP-dependent zinc metalloprotease FTSHI 3, chloroplastic n=1 Tax=Curcuma longa TaxID=136217 RepID=UPI003D9DF95E